MPHPRPLRKDLAGTPRQTDSNEKPRRIPGIQQTRGRFSERVAAQRKRLARR
jgi:hypothetical protein